MGGCTAADGCWCRIVLLSSCARSEREAGLCCRPFKTRLPRAEQRCLAKSRRCRPAGIVGVLGELLRHAGDLRNEVCMWHGVSQYPILPGETPFLASKRLSKCNPLRPLWWQQSCNYFAQLRRANAPTFQGHAMSSAIGPRFLLPPATGSSTKTVKQSAANI